MEPKGRVREAAYEITDGPGAARNPDELTNALFPPTPSDFMALDQLPLHPEYAHGDPHPNIRQSSGNPMEEGKEGF